MLVKLSSPFLYGTRVTSLGPQQLSMTVVVRAVFRLRPNEPLVAVESPIDQGFLSGDRYADDDEERTGALLHADDFADFKLGADLLLRGTAHAGEGRKAHELTVSFGVGAWQKRLRVHGRRVWTQNPLDPISRPLAFSEMPLTWANSYGGPEYARNPVGKGYKSPELPNIEHPDAPLRSPTAAVEPAGFGPINPSWPQRAGKRGKQYGKSWRDTRAPFYAEDFDWSFFQAAPPDQQVRGFLRGDELMAFENLHPQSRRFEARLPGIGPRVLVRYVDGATREPTMQLDTLLADVDGERVVLVWRGLVPVASDDFADVRTLYVACERLDDPLPRERHAERLDAFERDPLERERLVPPEVRARIEEARAAGEKAKAAAASAPPQPPPGDGLAWLGKMLQAAVPPEKRGAADALMAKLAEGREKARAHLAAMRAKGEQPALPKRDGVEDWMAATLQARRAELAARGLPVDRIDAMTRKLGEVRDRRRAAEAAMREQAKTVPATAASVSALDAIDEKIADASKGPPEPGAPPPPVPKLPEPGKGANLAGRDLSGRDLRGVDLEGAILRKANLSGASLAGAKLRRADLGEADLTGADLTGADLSLANLTAATAVRATFDRATLDQTLLARADLKGASLAGAHGKMTILQGTDLSEARAGGVRFFKAVGIAARFVGADLSRAELDTCVFISSTAGGARFDEATMTRTGFLRSDLSGSSFVEARGRGNSWQEAKLGGADFSYADLPEASFSGATLDGAKLFGARLRRARFQRASLVETDLSRADCLSAVFNKATLAGTKFAGANLFDVKLLGANASAKCDFSGANLKRAMWKQPG